MDRFFSKVRKTDKCWEWMASLDHRGYGRFKVSGKVLRAHRYAYEMLIGKIPEGLTIDHLCRNKICVNPFHLEPVTITENIKRVFNGYCPNGHLYTEKTTFHDSNRTHKCTICFRETKKRYRARKKSCSK